MNTNDKDRPEANERKIPDGGCLAWIIVAASFFMSFIQDGFTYSFGLILVPLAEHFQVGRTEASLTSSIQTFLTIGSGPVAVFLLRKVSHRLATFIGVCLSCLGLLSTVLYIKYIPQENSNIIFIYITLGGMAGLGLGLIYFSAIDILNFYFINRLGTANGIASAGSGLGQMAIAPLVHLTNSKLGLLGTLYTMIGLIGTGFVFSIFYKTPNIEERKSGDTKSNERNMLKILKQPRFLVILTSHFLWNIGIFAGMSFIADRAVQRKITDEAGSSVLLSIMGIANCIGRLVYGPVIDKFRNHILLFSFGTMAVNATTVLVSEYVTSFPGHAAISAIFGASFGAQVTCSIVIFKVLFGRVTEYLGIYVFIIGLSSYLGNFIVGSTFDSLGSYSLGFLTAGSLDLLGAGLQLCLLFKIINSESVKPSGESGQRNYGLSSDEIKV